MKIEEKLKELKTATELSRKRHEDLDELIGKALPLVAEMRSELQVAFQILELKYGRILDITKVLIIAGIPAILALLTTDLPFVKERNLLILGSTIMVLIAAALHVFVIYKIVNATRDFEEVLNSRASLLSEIGESYLNGARNKDLVRDLEKMEQEISAPGK